MFVELHKAFELKPPTNLSQAVSEYDSVFHECRTTSNWSPEKVETFVSTFFHFSFPQRLTIPIISLLTVQNSRPSTNQPFSRQRFPSRRFHLLSPFACREHPRISQSSTCKRPRHESTRASLTQGQGRLGRRKSPSWSISSTSSPTSSSATTSTISTSEPIPSS